MATDTAYRNPDRGFHYWARDEIKAPNSTGLWVPNVGDKVFDKVQGDFLITEVDITTGYSVMVPWFTPTAPDPEAKPSNLTGAGPGSVSESYRAFLNKAVTPATLTPDRRLHKYGSMVQYYRMFLGEDISEEFGQVISTFFDPSGTFLGDTVPFENMLVPGAVTQLIQVPAVGYTNADMENGELVTLVTYDAAGGAVSRDTLLVHNTQTVRQSDAAKRYVRSIGLESPWMSAADPLTLEFPINVTVESLPMTAVVYYSDGTLRRAGITDPQFSLMGLQDYIATTEGQEFPLVLSYKLAADEVSYNLVPAVNRKLVMDYVARTVTADGAYEVKLFVYPQWISAALGYRLEFWLYNLDRQNFYNVTPYVELATNSNPFDPKLYGVVQTTKWAIDLNEVDGRFAPHRHVQTVQLALLNAGPATANWEVFFTAGQAVGYGRDLFADIQYVNTNYWILRLANGFTDQANWLKNLYEKAEPLYNTTTEAVAPTPTHFKVVFAHNSYEFAITQWNSDLVVNNDIGDGGLMYIQWYRRTYESDLQLAITALPVKRRPS